MTSFRFPFPRIFVFLLFFWGLIFGSAAQETLRGMVRVDLEPVYAREMDVPYPLDLGTSRRRALEEASLNFAGMVYGWSFDYDIGEVARKIPERFDLVSLGSILFGDPRLSATDGEVRDARFYLWSEYRADLIQARRLEIWKGALYRSVQARGSGPLSGWSDADSWAEGKRAALEDAARAAVRSLLRASERNRPKEARGDLALAEFPLYSVQAGRWAATAKFRIHVRELVPFAAY
jgi:hypothetical protein